jgi:hypothetical protein
MFSGEAVFLGPGEPAPPTVKNAPLLFVSVLSLGLRMGFIICPMVTSGRALR